MDSAEHYAGLVFPATTDATSPDAPVGDTTWSMSQHHHSPPTSSSSTHSSLYSIVSNSPGTQYDDQNYPGSVEYDQRARNAVEAQNRLQNSPQSGGHGEHRALLLDTPQIESMAGPSRVLTRRQARVAQIAEHVRGDRSATAPADFVPEMMIGNQRAFDRNGYYAPYRIHTPYGATYNYSPDGGVHSPVLERRSYNGESTYNQPTIPIPMAPFPTQGPPHSPPYPSTPSSGSSSQHFHSRTGSLSSSNPRSASPALSVASMMTSASSHSHSMSPYNMQARSGGGRPKHRKQRLFNVDRKKICEMARENPNWRQEDIAAKFGVERSTISKILKEKDRWLNVADGEPLRVAKVRLPKFAEVEFHMGKWLERMSTEGKPITDAAIREAAKQAAKMMDISEEKFKASSGWIENFKQRRGIRKGVWDRSKNGQDGMDRMQMANGRNIRNWEGYNFDGTKIAASSQPVENHESTEADVESEESPGSSRTDGNEAAGLATQWPPHVEPSTTVDAQNYPTPSGSHPESSYARAADGSAAPLQVEDQAHARVTPAFPEAEAAIDTLLAFVHVNRDVLNLGEQDYSALMGIKRALFNLGADII